MSIVRQQWSVAKSLPAGVRSHFDGDWVVMSAEVPPEDERGGDIIRVKGLMVPEGLPVQAQHMPHAADGSPTTIGLLEETFDGEIEWKGQNVPAKLGRFSWAPGELAEKYKALWPKFINRVSIGAWVREAAPIKGKGYDITKSELFELSIVTFGANPAARAAIRNALGVVDPDALTKDDLIAAVSGMNDSLETIKAALPQIKSLASRLDDIESLIVAKSKGAAPTGDHQKQQDDSVARLVDALRSLRAGL